MSDLPPELQQRLQESGIPLPTSTTNADIDSAPVWTGRAAPRAPRPPRTQAEPEGPLQTPALFDTITTDQPSGVQSMNELLAEFYTWDSEQVRKFQERAFAAGLLGRSRDGVAWGVRGDDSTFSAWASILERAANFYAVDEQISPDDVLDMMIKGAPKSATGGGASTTVLPNPADLQRGFEGKAKDVLGRSLVGLDTINRFVGTVQGESQRFQQAQAGEGGGTITAPPDPSTVAERQLREEFPAEAGAHDVASQFETFLRIILGGPR